MKLNFHLKSYLVILIFIGVVASSPVNFLDLDHSLSPYSYHEKKLSSDPLKASFSTNEASIAISPIEIDMDIGLTWLHCSYVSGAGTILDPFYIHDLVIDAQGAQAGIVIKNSKDVYWKIQNCTIFNAKDKIDSSAIYVENSENGWISLSHFSNNNTIGIRIQNSNNILITHNVCEKAVYGIYITSSNYCSIKNNINNLNDYGIYCESSKNIIAYENSNKENHFSGMFLGDLQNSTFSDNYCLSNNQGIILTKCVDMNLNNNTCSQNIFDGILIGETSQCNLFQNNLQKNGKGGISVGTSSFITISSGLLEENNVGIDFYSTLNSMIISNRISNNSIGIQFISSDHNQIQLNNITNNDIGIYIKSSSDNLIVSNVYEHNNQDLKEIENWFSWQYILIAMGVVVVIIGIFKFFNWRNSYSRKLK